MPCVAASRLVLAKTGIANARFAGISRNIFADDGGCMIPFHLGQKNIEGIFFCSQIIGGTFIGPTAKQEIFYGEEIQ